MYIICNYSIYSVYHLISSLSSSFFANIYEHSLAIKYRSYFFLKAPRQYIHLSHSPKKPKCACAYINSCFGGKWMDVIIVCVCA